jgi:hypothetical protein
VPVAAKRPSAAVASCTSRSPRWAYRLIGHAIVPAHKDTFAYVDDFTRLPPLARDLFEREANHIYARVGLTQHSAGLT